jgi:hypothetical protein
MTKTPPSLTLNEPYQGESVEAPLVGSASRVSVKKHLNDQRFVGGLQTSFGIFFICSFNIIIIIMMPTDTRIAKQRHTHAPSGKRQASPQVIGQI